MRICLPTIISTSLVDALDVLLTDATIRLGAYKKQRRAMYKRV